MVAAGNVALGRIGGNSDGSIMRRVIAIAVAAVTLAGCSSTPDYLKLDYYKSAPAPVQLQLESTPPGAEARTSIGPGCKTPCSVSVTPADGMTSFLVNYSMPGKQPAGVPVNVIRTDGGMFSSGTVKVEPNPVMAELQSMGPPPKPHRPKPKKPRDTAAAPAGSAFPDPGQPPPGTATR
jgi:hypothetical protein